MNIEEVLTEYTDLTHKRDEAYEVYRHFEIRINYLAHDNKVPVELKDIEGNATGFTITTPDDLWKARSGMVIAVCGAEWMSCYGAVRNDAEMFIHILRNLDHAHLVHKGY